MHHWFIGDIHGCYDALVRLEARIEQRSGSLAAEPHIVSLGDMVDRGPDSAQVVKHFRERAGQGTHSAILGNHEEMMLRVVHQTVPEAFRDRPLPRHVIPGEDLRRRSPRGPMLTRTEFHELNRLLWQSQGGTPALRSWGQDPTQPSSWRIDEDDLGFLCGLPLIFECDSAVATHALASAEDLLLLRATTYATPTGAMNPREAETYQAVLWRRSLPRHRPDAKTHVSGHTPLRRPRRYRKRGLVRVDTGACFDRRLTAWCAELDETLSVPTHD